MAAVFVSEDGKAMRKGLVLGDRYAYVLNNGWPTFVLNSGGGSDTPSNTTPRGARGGSGRVGERGPSGEAVALQVGGPELLRLERLFQQISGRATARPPP